MGFTLVGAMHRARRTRVRSSRKRARDRHRFRVDISSSSFPRFSRNLNTGESVATGTRIEVAHQTILHASEYPSHIVLPVIPGPA